MIIRIRGAREHNLQGVDVDIGDGLTVITGVSGSGKTSLAFDTLYHEARRRFLDIFSLGAAGLRLSPAAVDAITGLGPAIAVGQNLLNRNPGSTLATASGLHPFLRLLYANFGVRHCPRCGSALAVLSDDEIVERMVDLAQQGPITVAAPLVRRATGSHATLLKLLSDEFGDATLRVDGQPGRPHALDPASPHSIEVEVDRLAGLITATRARQALEQVAALSGDALIVRRWPSGETWIFARAPVCAACGAWIGELRPLHFHQGCPHCRGKGCAACHDTGLHPLAAAVRWEGLRLPDLLAQPVDEVWAIFERADLPTSAGRLRSEIERRLEALRTVGLGYLALDRPSPTLSRGEAQRVRLAVALTSRLEDMLHVLDEPTVGQHPADVARLLPAFRRLGGPVVYVEHDRLAAAHADRAIDLGPGAGPQGGRVVFAGTPAELWAADTATGRFFSLRERVALPGQRPAPQSFLTVRGACLRNLQDDRRADPARPADGDHRRLRLGQEHACRGCAGRLAERRQAGRLPGHRGPADQARVRGSEPDRAQPALESGHLHQAGRYHPRPVCVRHGAVAIALLVQPAGGRLPGVRGHGRAGSADALPALHLDSLRRLRRPAILGRGAGGQDAVRRAPVVDRRLLCADHRRGDRAAAR